MLTRSSTASSGQSTLVTPCDDLDQKDPRLRYPDVSKVPYTEHQLINPTEIKFTTNNAYEADIPEQHPSFSSLGATDVYVHS